MMTEGKAMEREALIELFLDEVAEIFDAELPVYPNEHFPNARNPLTGNPVTARRLLELIRLGK